MANLSPPWYTLLNKFKHTFGCDPAVTVGNFENAYESVMNIPIIVDDERKGMALRTLIRQGFPMGNIHVNTTVKNSKGMVWEAIVVEDYKQLQGVITDALTGNPLFVEAKPRVLPPSFTQMGLIMTKSIVQFFNDDLADFYSNFNGVTAQVTSELIQQSFGAKDTLYILMGTSTK